MSRSNPSSRAPLVSGSTLRASINSVLLMPLPAKSRTALSKNPSQELLLLLAKPSSSLRFRATSLSRLTVSTTLLAPDTVPARERCRLPIAFDWLWRVNALKLSELALTGSLNVNINTSAAKSITKSVSIGGVMSGITSAACRVLTTEDRPTIS